MLSSLAYLLILLLLNLPALADENIMDFSWIKDLNAQAENLAHAHQEEARAIVNQALGAASQQKHCKIAKAFAIQAEKITRKSLGINQDEKSFQYPQLLVFVSFSIPIETLKTLATQVNQAGGKVVLRGLINSSFKQTAEKAKELQEEVIIDPILFDTYQVKVIPTFILRGEESKDEVQIGFHKGPAHDQLSGNVSLEYALEQFAALGSARTEAIELLKKLRKKP